MKSKMKKLKGTTRQFEIEMPKEMVDKVFDETLEDIRKNTSMPGFRQGKAPMDMIRKKHNQDAVDEVKRRLIPEGYQIALEEHDIRPVSYPEVSDVDISLNGTLVFKAVVDAHPEVKLQKYKALKVNIEKVSVSDKEVTEALERVRGMYAEFTDTDRPLERGDFGICDVETEMDGKIISQKRENMWIEADKEASMLGMGEELIGLKKGDSKDIDTTLPDGYPDKKYAGKKAVFKVQIKETKEKKLPELDDELAKKMGKEKIEELRDELKSQLLQRKEADARIVMKNQIMEQLLKKHSFDMPATMVERQLKVLMERAENDLRSKGVSNEAIEEHKEKLKKQLAKEAENKVCLYFILDVIADQEKVEVTDEEEDEWLKSLAASYSQPFDKVKKYYQDNNLLDGLKEQLREDKTLDLLLEEATITKK